MKNNFDLKNYMRDNKVGAYQQLNEMWYQDINQALGDFNVIKEEEAVEEREMREGKNAKFFVDSDDSWDTEAESWQATLAKKGIKTKVTATMGGYEITLADASQKPALEKWLSRLNLTLDPYDLEEMGGVKSIGDAGKMATPNSRPNLGRHRSSDMLDKMSKKDHKTNTVVGAKAAAYKAPHMKEDEFKSFGDPDLTLNDLNKDIVITPFELEKTWNDVYGEDFKTEYSGAYSYLTKNYKNFTIVDLGDVWERMYGEDFLYEYSGIAKWLFSNQGKTSSKDKIAPKMKEDVNEIGGHGDAHDNPKLQAAAKYLVQNRDKYLTQDYFFPRAISILSSKSDKDLYDYIVNNWHSDGVYDVVAHMKSRIEKDMYANTDPNIADPINEDDDIFAGSDTANWNDRGNHTADWDLDFVGKQVGNWKSDIEQQAGSISWTSEKYPNAIIYATPGWEGVDGIAVEVHDSEDGFMDEPKLQKVVGAGTDLWKTEKGYMALMAKIFNTLEKMLKPSEEMAEDDGTGRQINHDMNDDISKDPSEFEDAIQEGTQDWNHTWEYDIVDLLDDGMSKPEILTHFTDILKIARSSMEESIENEDADPFDNIKAGINKITHDGDTNPFNVDNDDMDDEPNDYRFDQLGGDKIKAGIEGLMADGFDYREILQFVKDTIASKRNY